MPRTLPCLASLGLGLLLLLAGARPGSAEEPPLRLAVIALPGEREVPPALLDLVEVQFAESRQLLLLERSRIADVLEERELGSVLGAEAAVELGTLLRADALLLLTANRVQGAGTLLRFRLLDAHGGLKLTDGTALLGSGTGVLDRVAATVVGRVRRSLASAGATVDAVPVAVIGFTSENVSRRFDWVAGVLAAGIEERLMGRTGLAVLERERLQALVDEDRITGSLPTALRASALLVGGTLRVEPTDGTPVIRLVLTTRRGAATLGTTELRGALADLPALAARTADAVAARTGSPGRSTGMSVEEEVGLLLDEIRVRRRLGDRDHALRLLEGAHALAPRRLDLEFQLLELGTEVLRHELTERAPRTQEERSAFYGRAVPAAFRRIALAERIIASSLPHRLHSHYHHFGWGDPRRSYFVPGILDLFTLPRLHMGPAGAGPDVRATLVEDLRRLLQRYRDVVRGENDHVLASLLAAAAKGFPELVPEGEDPLAFAIGVREEAAALMRRIAIPEGPTGLRCGDELLHGSRRRELMEVLLAHPEPLVRFSGLRTAARSAKDPTQREIQARSALALLRDPLIDEIPAGLSYPWYRKDVEALTRLLTDETERRRIREELLGERQPTRPVASPPPRYRLLSGTAFGETFEGRRLVDEEGVLAVVGTSKSGTARSLVLHRLARDPIDVSATQALPLRGTVPGSGFAAAARADGSVFIGNAAVGIVHFPPTGEPRGVRPAGEGEAAPIRALAAAAGKIYALVGGPHDASGLLEIDPEGGGERLMLSSRSLRPTSTLDGRPLRALCGAADGKSLLLEAGPLPVPPAGDPGGPNAISTFYRFQPATGSAEMLLRQVQVGFLGESGHISVRRAGTHALVEALPLILDLDLESGNYVVLYKVPVNRTVRHIPSLWQGAGWPSPITRADADLLCRDHRTPKLFVEDEEMPVPLWSRVERSNPKAQWPEIRDALPRPDGVLLLGPNRLYELVRIEERVRSQDKSSR